MTSLNRAKGLFASACFVAFANVGCATTIAGKYPHLDRRPVCLLVPGIESDSTEFIFAGGNVPISNFHPEVVDRVAAEARTVFEYDPAADPSSVSYLPAPYNELQCPERFSPLHSKDAETRALPGASVDLLVRERRPEVAPRAVTEKLASCTSPSSGQLKPIEYTVSFNVYVTKEGQAVAAKVVQSTLGDRKIEACMAKVLRTTSWPMVVAAAPAVSSAPAALKAFLAQSAPILQPPNVGDRPSGIYPKQAPRGAPAGVRPPRIFVVPLNPLAAAVAVFGIVYFWSSEDAPAWKDELNPITRQQYTSLQEYEQVQRLSPQEILQRQQAHIKATQPQAPPAPTPTPSPQALPQPESQKQLECPRNEIFVPERTDNSTGCTDKNGNVRCYSRKHSPCAGVHTHGILHYQEIRRGICTEVHKEAVRCDGPFLVSGPCGSVSTVECGKGGPEISGIFLE